MNLNPLAAGLRRYLIAHTFAAATSQGVSEWLSTHRGDSDDALAAHAADAPDVTRLLTVEYQDAWERGLALEWQSDAGFRRIGKLLEDIGRYEHEHGRPHVTACCVKRGSGSPGVGFVGLLTRLDGTASAGDPDRVWLRELLRSARWWQYAFPPACVRVDWSARRHHELVYDPTALPDAHYDRLAARISRLA